MKNTPSPEALAKLVAHENEHWSAQFANQDFSHAYTSYWWKEYYYSIADHIDAIIPEKSSIIEFGSGSGKASMHLRNRHKLTLFDISEEALNYSRRLGHRLNCKNIKFIQGDCFDSEIMSKTYDFVWNIGVIEHYNKRDAISLAAEMLRICRNGGYVALGVPNFRGIHIKLAKLRTLKLLSKLLPGYVFDNELDYREEDLVEILDKAAKRMGLVLDKADIHGFGNPLPTGSPKWLVNSFGRPLSYLAKDRFFLNMIVVKKIGKAA